MRSTTAAIIATAGATVSALVCAYIYDVRYPTAWIDNLDLFLGFGMYASIFLAGVSLIWLIVSLILRVRKSRRPA